MISLSEFDTILPWLFTSIGIIFITRVGYVYTKIGQPISPNFKAQKKLLAVAGSGGHTTELIRLLSSLPSDFTSCHYVVASSDQISASKVKSFEATRSSHEDCVIFKIPRSREVAQSWTSTMYTTFMACLASISVMWKSKPDVLLCNGPGTCIPLCIVALLFKVIWIGWTDIVFVESICRVTSMSMSGRLLYPFADLFFVQWPQLLKDYPKAKYLGGRLV